MSTILLAAGWSPEIFLTSPKYNCRTQNGAKAELQDADGQTALHKAAAQVRSHTTDGFATYDCQRAVVAACECLGGSCRPNNPHFSMKASQG